MDDPIGRKATIEVVEKYFREVLKLNPDLLRDAIITLPSAPPMSYRMGYQAGYAAALREQRSCEGCKNEYVGMDYICNHCFRNVRDCYEPKEKPSNGKA